MDAAALAHNFRVFAEADCASEPLYAALSIAIAERPALLDLLMTAPYPQRRPVLLFAATHDLLLSGATHPLAAFYRSRTEEAAWRTDVGAAGPLFADFCDERHDAIAALLASRTVQTNEVGRSAGLRLALAELAGDRPVALIDVGCSAGLNLLVDRFRFEDRLVDGSIRMFHPPPNPTNVGAGSRHLEPDLTNVRSGAVAAPCGDVVVRTAFIGNDPECGPIPPIAQRFGVDLAPLDVHDERDARWLRACAWPSDLERHERLAAALALARTVALDVRRGAADRHLPAVIEDVESGVRPVVFHSWVVSYFDAAAKRRFVDAVRTMIVERDGAWISAEGPGVLAALTSPGPDADADPVRREATRWHLTTRVDGRPWSRLLALSHPHCRWIDRSVANPR